MKKVYIKCPKCGCDTKFTKPTFKEQLDSVLAWRKEDPDDVAAEDMLDYIFCELQNLKTLKDFDEFHFQTTPENCPKCGNLFAPVNIDGVKES